MTGGISQPRVTKNSQGKLLSYNLPHRAHTVKVYPTESLNGSTVILYGHENGVRIVWRGGRPFKSQQEFIADPKKSNGTSNAVVLLDSDEEGEMSQPFMDKPEFEDEEEGLDPSQPYPGIVQELDLFFGIAVLHLAVLPSSILKADGSSWRALEPLKKTLVFVAACADNVIRLVTLPLTPPSPASKSRPELRADFTSANAGHGKWGETVIILSGHQKASDGVSISIDITTSAKEPYFVVASHSREVTGLLLLYRMSIKSPKLHAEPFQCAYLATPAKTISFNPSISKQHSSQLLVAESTGVCRIYDYRLLNKSHEESDTPSPERGTWLLSLYVGFQNIKSDSLYTGVHAGFGRKNIVDAQWVSDGQAIIILLSDGEWAVWDIEGVGPTASQGLLSRQGIKGGSKSEYSLTGYIDATTKSKSGPPQIASSKFAPMTPGTRKSVDLFSGRGPGVFVRGQLSVVEVPSSSSTSPVEESIFFWLGDTFAVIPSLSKYWAAHTTKASGGSLFAGTAGRMIKLENIDLQGERCSAIAQISKCSSSLVSDVIVLGEHRFVLLDTGKEAKEDKAPKPSSKLVLAEKPAKSSGLDLGNGELDVNGIEMALARMENGNGAKRKIF